MPRVVACLIVLFLIVGLAGPAPAAPGDPPSSPSLSHPATITLVTGQTVRVDDRGTVVLLDPDGSSADGYRIQVEDSDLFVTPDEAQRHLTAGRLDPQLFNITDLVEQGYQDKPLPLIVTYAEQRAQVAPAGAQQGRELPSINGRSLSVDRGHAAEFWASVAGPATALAGGIEKIWLDGRVSASLDVSVPQVGAPAAWQQGLDGTGVTVAVLDTGVDANHPDLAGKVTESVNFTDSPTVEDRLGHGTHVASTVAGTGAASGGARKGVAPGAGIINGKVLNDGGGGQLSWIIAGMEWAASRAPIVSMSLGSPAASDGTDPMSQAVNALTASTGALFVVAAGNHGQFQQPLVTSPAAADSALAVGAVDRTDALASFSNYGPRTGDSAVKPDITAPGVGIGAARAAGTSIGEVIDEHHTRLNGTSMATPHVSGAAAILAQRNGSWRAGELKSALMAAARPTDGLTAYQQGTGRMDVAAAVDNAIQVDRTNLSLGRFTGPYGSLPPVERAVTYRNTGAGPVTLDLAVTAKRADGTPAASDVLRLSESSLTVPAGGTASVTLTLDPNRGELGLYDGALTATPSGGHPLRSAVGFHKELLHKVTVIGTARDGRPANSTQVSPAAVTAWDPAIALSARAAFVDGRAELLLPAGTYYLIGTVPTMDSSGQVPIEATTVVKDDVSIQGEVTLAFDARAGKEIRANVDKETEPAPLADFVTRSIDGAILLTGQGYQQTVDRLFAVPTPPVRRGEFEHATWMQLREPRLTVRVQGRDIRLRPDYLGSPQPAQLLDGRHRLPVAYVGTGTPEEIARHDLTGKLALIEQSPSITLEQQVRNAAAGKAAVAAVFAVQPGRVYDDVAANLPIPGWNLSHEEGRKLVGLLGRGRVDLDVRAVAFSPYMYDFVIPFRQRIPDDLTVQPRRGDLAVVHNRLHSVRANQFGAHGSRYSPLPLFSFGALMAVPLPFEQDRYFLANGKELLGVTADKDLQAVMQTADRPPAAGKTSTVSWFRAPLAPGVSGEGPPVSRSADTIFLFMNEFIDAEPNHSYSGPAEQSAARIYRDGQLVAQGPHAVGPAQVGVEQPATYRVELDIQKGRPDWRVATASSSAWTFRSARPASGVTENLPVVRAQWDLGLGLDNTARDNSWFDLRLRAGTQSRATSVAVKHARAWVSFDDGASWRQVDHLRAKDGGVFDGSVRHPKRSQTSGFVSLRLDVTDVAGNRFEQTLIRAYELR